MSKNSVDIENVLNDCLFIIAHVKELVEGVGSGSDYLQTLYDRIEAAMSRYKVR